MTSTTLYYPLGVVGVGCGCRCPLPRRAPPTTPLQRRSFQFLHPSTASSAPPPRGRRIGADDDDFLLTLDLDEPDGDEEGSPWEGALVYQRDAATHHVEYATTLERLGLADLSSPHSRARAAAMGILLSSGNAGAATPVLVSVDITRRRGRLRLDGIVRTVITLGCYSCAEPAPQGIFTNFSLLLTEDPVEEPDVVDLGTVYEDRTKSPLLTGSQDEDDEDIDWDDRLHFPVGEKEIDISKHIRDMIHLEITLDAFCSPSCKGLCLVCGTNLNTGSCNCSTEQPQPKDAKRPGSLKDLLKPMQRR